MSTSVTVVHEYMTQHITIIPYPYYIGTYTFLITIENVYTWYLNIDLQKLAVFNLFYNCLIKNNLY